MNKTFRQRWCWCLCGWLLWCGALCADEPASEREKLVKEAFRKADLNNDGNLTPEEFVGKRQAAQVLLRDFQLFDFDQDGQLSLAEFDPIAFGVEQDKRGPVRDLINSIVDDFVAEFDRDFDDWDSRPNEKIRLNTFSEKLAAKIPEQVLLTADTDRDGKVSRAEARAFIEVEMGVFSTERSSPSATTPIRRSCCRWRPAAGRTTSLGISRSGR